MPHFVHIVNIAYMTAAPVAAYLALNSSGDDDSSEQRRQCQVGGTKQNMYKVDTGNIY